MKLLSLLVHPRQVASVTEIKCAAVPGPGSRSCGRGSLQAGSCLTLKGATFAARAGGCWNLLPLSDPKEPGFGEGLLGTLHKTSVLQGV